MTVTEIGCMGIKPGLDIMNEATPEGQVLPKAYRPVTTKPGGPARAFWGLGLEDPTKVWALFDFDSVQAHMKFAEEYGEEIVKDLPTILTHGVFMKHLALSPSSSVALRSAVTQLIFIHFPGNITESQKGDAQSQLEAIVGNATRGCFDLTAVSWGWSVETDFPLLAAEGEAGSALAAIIGWKELRAQELFIESPAWKEAEAQMKGVRGVISISQERVCCRNSERKVE